MTRSLLSFRDGPFCDLLAAANAKQGGSQFEADRDKLSGKAFARAGLHKSLKPEH